MTEAATQGKTNNILICIEDILKVLQLESFTLEKAPIYCSYKYEMKLGEIKLRLLRSFKINIFYHTDSRYNENLACVLCTYTGLVW